MAKYNFWGDEVDEHGRVIETESWWEKSKRKSWDEEAEDRPKWSNYSGRGKDHSLSGFWGERFGGFKSWFGGGSADEQRLARALQAVRRVGRIVYDKKALFTWRTEGDVQMTDKQGAVVVTLDPTLLGKVEGLDWTEGQKVDALVGDSLSEASYKREVYPTENIHHGDIGGTAAEIARKQREAGKIKPEFELSVGRVLAQMGKSAFGAASHLYAGRKVVEPFPGYTGYLDQERAFSTRPEVKEAVAESVREGLRADPRSFPAAAAAALWRTLTDESLDVPMSEPMQEAVGRASEALRKAAATASSPDDIKTATEDVMRELAEFCIENDDEGEGEASQPWEEAAGGGQVVKSCSQQMRLKDGTSENGRGKAREDEAQNAENLVTQEFRREDEEDSKVFGIGRDKGVKPYPTFSIKQKLTAEGKHAYQKALRKVRPLIAKTRAALTFRNEQTAMNETGLRRGNVDEAGIFKLAMRDPRVFARQEIHSQPQVRLGVLVDESGSMCSWAYSGGTRADLSRESAILLAHACTGLKGVSLSIWGHTANRAPAQDGALVYRYLDHGMSDPTMLGEIKARANNADGWAIAYCVKQMMALGNDEESRILFVLADGYPAAFGYGDCESMDHVRSVTKFAAKNGIQVFCLGMGDGLDPRGLERMYGKNGFAMVPDVSKMPRALGKLLERALRTGQVA